MYVCMYCAHQWSCQNLPRRPAVASCKILNTPMAMPESSEKASSSIIKDNSQHPWPYYFICAIVLVPCFCCTFSSEINSCTMQTAQMCSANSSTIIADLCQGGQGETRIRRKAVEFHRGQGKTRISPGVPGRPGENQDKEESHGVPGWPGKNQDKEESHGVPGRPGENQDKEKSHGVPGGPGEKGKTRRRREAMECQGGQGKTRIRGKTKICS